MNKIIIILKLIRTKQWIKNVFVMIPFILSLKFMDINFENYFNFFMCVVSFCFISSSIYIINDLVDRKEDLLHHKKNNRPLANGSISVKFALIIFTLLIISSFSIVLIFFNIKALAVMIIYFANSILYTLLTKNYAIFDAFSIALGFIFRVFFGIFCFDTPISKWIIILTFNLCLFLAFTKRGKDFVTDGYFRKSLKGYTKEMLEKFMIISSVLAIASYTMYANEMTNLTNNYGFTITNIFVIFGIFRYLQALHLNTADVGDSGVIIYKDMIFLANLVLWAIVLVACLIFS